jgi:hypothetical protein
VPTVVATIGCSDYVGIMACPADSPDHPHRLGPQVPHRV